MRIDSPFLLVVALLVLAALVVLVVVLGRRRAAALAAAGAGRTRRRSLPLVLTVVGIAVLALAVAGPVARIPVPRSAGTLIVAVDVSASMTATDVAPSRLAAAKKAAVALIAAQPDSVDVGVVAFESGALTTAKPSADHAAATAAVERLHASGGTSLGDAILGSLSAITGKQVAIGRNGSLPDLGYRSSATVVLFSDGEDGERGADAKTAATLAENSGVHIDTVGVGTAQGTTVTVDGYRLRTALDAAELRAIAATSGGSYHPASDAGQLDGIASGIDLRLEVAPQDVPLAGAFIALALMLLALGAGLTIIRTGRLV